MLVGERMSTPVLTITPEVPVQDALARMRSDNVRRYPVMDKREKLIGIVTETDLLNASPSDATVLSAWEINSLLAKITVERVMTKKVITITENTPIEEAARIMSDHKISSLPVIRDESLVGIITETDLFNLLLEMTGARTSGIRLTVEVLNSRGKLHELAGVIQELGGDILGMAAILGRRAETRILTLKIDGVNMDVLRQAINPLVENIVDIRETTGH